MGQYAVALAYALELLSALKPLRGASAQTIATWQLAEGLKSKRDITDGQLKMLTYVALMRKRKRGGDPLCKIGRNIAICAAIEAVCGRFEFAVTRNELSTTPSACSIVAEALNRLGENLTEAAVVKIWQRGPYVSEMRDDGGPVGPVRHE